jgi:hypothetical protein
MKTNSKDQKKKKSGSVVSITDALSVLKGKARSKIRQRQQQRTMKEPKAPELSGKNVPGFPIIEGLDEEKGIIGRGIVALNRALFEQTLYESERLGKIRGILSKIEVGLLDIDLFNKLDPAQQLKIFEILRKDSESTVNFLERMQRNSLQVMVVFEIYKKLMETINPEEDKSNKGLPPDVDKSKVMQVRGALLEMMK